MFFYEAAHSDTDFFYCGRVIRRFNKSFKFDTGKPLTFRNFFWIGN